VLVSTVNPYVPPSGSTRPPPPLSAKPGSGLDFGRALGFFFQDPNWVQKLLIGSLFTILSMFLIGGVFVAGYAVRIVRRTARGEPYPLPEWDDFGGLFADGLTAMGAYLLHLVPAVLGAGAAILPIVIMGARDDSEPSPAILFALIPLILLATVVFFAVLLYFPAVFTRLAVEERFGAALELEANWAFLKRNFSNYLLALAAFFVANFLAQFGILLFCIGILPATFWSQCVGAYALGEVAYRDSGRTRPASS
jgi:hypothetical protein